MSVAARSSVWRQEHPWSFWTIVAILVLLNGWWNYHHPIGDLFDALIVVIWAARSDMRARVDWRSRGGDRRARTVPILRLRKSRHPDLTHQQERTMTSLGVRELQSEALVM